MTTHSKILWAASVLALTVPALAQNDKAVHDRMVKLQSEANRLQAVDPAGALVLKTKANDLRQSLIHPGAPTGGGSYSVVAAPYSVSGPCGGLDSGTPGATVGGSMTSAPIAILDYTTITDTITIGGLGAQTFDVDLNVNIVHTWNSDLVIKLTSPAGTIATVSAYNGGSYDDVFNGTLFDDESANDVLTYGYVNGVAAPDLRPESGFNALFRGENPNGVWTLSVEDTAGADQGFLNNWSLSITDGVVVHVPPSYAMTTHTTGVISV